jgi:2-hydroxy-6-oxonona-2,4-dienedioate hydrolase/4,5:9,10-diseco-3-hydroxy-5,9,17-trioxoandrosta-1(10),2-diene-4-oate hydrolase
MSLTFAGTSRTATVNGLKIHYHEAGTGMPLVFIHGGGPGASGWSNFNRNIDAFAAHWRVIIIDLPGFGESDHMVPEDGIFAGYADNVLGLMDVLGIDKAHVIGNSLGGGTGLMMAMRAPERVGRLVMMGTAGGLPVFGLFPSEGQRKLSAFYEGEGGPTIEKLRDFIHSLVYDPTTVSEAMLQQRFEVATRPEVIANPPLKFKGGKPFEDLWLMNLRGVNHEIMLISGREDRVTPLDANFILLKLLPNARLYVLPQCGHWAQWEKADEFNTTVDCFLKQAK